MDLEEFIASTQESHAARENVRLWLDAAIDRVTQLWEMEGWAEVTVGQRDDSGSLYRIGIRDDNLWLQVDNFQTGQTETTKLASLVDEEPS